MNAKTKKKTPNKIISVTNEIKNGSGVSVWFGLIHHTISHSRHVADMHAYQIALAHQVMSIRCRQKWFNHSSNDTLNNEIVNSKRRSMWLRADPNDTNDSSNDTISESIESDLKQIKDSYSCMAMAYTLLFYRLVIYTKIETIFINLYCPYERKTASIPDRLDLRYKLMDKMN